MGNFTTIRAAVKTLLESVPEIQVVYDYHEPNLSGYPAITFDVSDSENDFLTDTENIRTYSFLVVIYQDIADQGLAFANTVLDTASDAVIDKLEQNLQLGGTVDWSVPLVGIRENVERPQGLVRTQQLTLRAKFTSTVL